MISNSQKIKTTQNKDTISGNDYDQTMITNANKRKY